MRWEYINITKADNMLMSGWKLYIYGNTVTDGVLAAYILRRFLVDMDITAKIATNSIIRRNFHSNRAWSSMVIYLDPFCVKNLDLLVDTIRKYLEVRGYKSRGIIPGAKSIYGNLIHMRYDLQIPINPCIGCNYETYLANYRGEYGDYNIPNNSDII